MSSRALLLVLVLAAVLPAGAARRLRPYPLTCAGSTVGNSTDNDVRLRYGVGLFVKDEAHGGGRYYVDPGRGVTLHTEIGVDRIIEAVTYSRGVHLPRRTSKRPDRAVTPRLKTDFPVSGFTLGAPPEVVLRKLGRPQSTVQRGTTRVLRYQADEKSMADVLVYEAELTFEKNRLTTIRLYNGE